jgi:hypothetical protein
MHAGGGVNGVALSQENFQGHINTNTVEAA